MFNFSKSTNKISQAFSESLREDAIKDEREELRKNIAHQKASQKKAKRNRASKVACHPCRLPRHAYFPTMTTKAFDDEDIKSGTSTSLSQLMKESDLPTAQPDFVQQVILGVLQSLKNLHDRGMFHGALSPSCILIDATDGRVEACNIRLRMSNCCCGDPTYASPQMLKGKMTDARLADMWAVGCILLELRFGLPQGWTTSCQKMSKSSRKSSATKRRIAKALYKARMGQFLKRIGAKKATTVGDYHLQNLLCNWLLVTKVGPRGLTDQVLRHSWFKYEYPTITAA